MTFSKCLLSRLCQLVPQLKHQFVEETKISIVSKPNYLNDYTYFLIAERPFRNNKTAEINFKCLFTTTKLPDIKVIKPFRLSYYEWTFSSLHSRPFLFIQSYKIKTWNGNDLYFLNLQLSFVRDELVLGGLWH